MIGERCLYKNFPGAQFNYLGARIASAGEKGSVAAKAALGSIDWQVWFHGEGMPPVLPTPVLDKLKEAQELGALWSNGGWAEAGAPRPGPGWP